MFTGLRRPERALRSPTVASGGCFFTGSLFCSSRIPQPPLLLRRPENGGACAWPVMSSDVVGQDEHRMP